MTTNMRMAGSDARVNRSPNSLPVRQRRPGWTALALTLIVGFAAFGGFAYKQAGAKTPVLVMVTTVPAGHVIARSDLTTVPLAGGLTAIEGRALSKVVGLRTAVTVVAGTPVQQSMLSTAGSPGPGMAQVGVVVTSGQVPADVVQPGDVVEVLQVPGTSQSSGGSPNQAQVLVRSATVWSSRSDSSQSGRTLLTLTIPGDAVNEVVAASDAGQIAVAKLGSGS